MQDTAQFDWRQLIGFYQPSSVRFDYEKRTVEFKNSLPPNGFWNLFPQKQVTCNFGDIEAAEQYSTNGLLAVHLKTTKGSRVFLSDVVPRFDQFAANCQRVLQAKDERTDA